MDKRESTVNEEERTQSLRTSTVTITVNKDERKQLKQAAKDARLTVSGYCRAVLFGQMAVKEVVRSKTF